MTFQTGSEYETLFKDKKSKTIIEKYVESLNGLEKQIGSADSVDANIKIEEAAHALGRESRELIELLTKKTKWSASFSLTEVTPDGDTQSSAQLQMDNECRDKHEEKFPMFDPADTPSSFS